MFLLLIILLSIIVNYTAQTTKPELKLTFIPDEKYYSPYNTLEILCEIINPTDHTESPQLWYIDRKTGKHTPMSRGVLINPTDDSPDIFKHNKHQRLQFVKKNHIRIRSLLTEDTAQYECNCPDCEEVIGKQTKELHVMKLAEPKWHIEPSWPLQEHIKSIIECTIDDFYPYVNHKILRNHYDITSEGKSLIPITNIYPQKLSWEATVIPSADWHNTTLRCTVTEGNHEMHAIKVLEVLFTSRFLSCHNRQLINMMKEEASIECTYAGNPEPTLIWRRKTDKYPLASIPGIRIQIIDEHHGKYKSIVTFNRKILTTTSDNKKSNITKDTYYQELLTNSFIAELEHNYEVINTRSISIVFIAGQIKEEKYNNLSIKIKHNFHVLIILISFLII
ncbi:hypothetical protein I4U23_027406 [Adineta vaga]|nr:hypothetical protein I4U23_027406 [Adineta vaga]